MTERLSEFRPRTTTRDRIEQHLACGATLDEIVTSLGVSAELVEKAMDRMDRAVAS